ncbi:MAG: right-handed parallel beta-helix repeat-containing protein [Rhodospirillales bacterium]|nr:right-handed parallel beta-helix repeat-containing protein [Rhodospirillales bacterium]
MYRSVVSQQGRVTLEADANEAEEIRADESRAELIDIIGPTGVPDDGFKVTVPGAGLQPFDFSIGKGTLYLGGVRVRQDDHKATYLGQQQTEWIDYPAGAPAGYPANTSPFTEAVYLSVTEQEIGAVEDEALREVALGGPDTAARTRLIQRVQRMQVTGPDCESAFAAVLKKVYAAGAVFDPATMRLDSNMRLRVNFIPEPATTDACQPTAQSGFLGPENQLIRVQVIGADTMLWGWDNASFLYRAVLTSPKTLRLQGIPVDVHHHPRVNQWVELLGTVVNLGDKARMAGPVGTAMQVEAYDPDDRTVTLKTAVPADFLTTHPLPLFLRVWENRITFVPDGTTPVELVGSNGTGTGVRVYAKGDASVTGDYWMIGVRPSTPQSILPARLAQFQPPDGPKRWVTPLAVIAWHGDLKTADVTDCRPPFLDLVELTRRKSECCELSVAPGEDIQKAIDSLPAEGGSVCLKAGTHRIRAAIRLDKSRVTLHGESPGTVVESAPPATAGPLMLDIGNREKPLADVAVRDIHFAWNDVATGVVRTFVQIERCARARIHRCLFTAATAAASFPLFGAILAHECRDLTVAENVMEGMYFGLLVMQCTGHVEVQRNAIRGLTMTLQLTPARAAEFSLSFAGILLVNASTVASSRIEHNQIEHFMTGIILGPNLDGSSIVANTIRRSRARAATTGSIPRDILDAIGLMAYLDGHNYGIDCASDHCAIRANRIDLRSAQWGGIRTSGLHTAVDVNVIEAAVDPEEEAGRPAGIYCRAQSDFEGAHHALVRDNVLRGSQAGITISRCNEVEVSRNHIDGAGAAWYGVRMNDVSGAVVRDNQISQMSMSEIALHVAVFATDGDRNRFEGNRVRECRVGILAGHEADVEVSRNCVEGAGEVGIWALFYGSAAICGNRVANCGFKAEVGHAIFADAWAADSNLLLEDCEVVDTGISPGGTFKAPGNTIGISGNLFTCQLVGNRVSYTNRDLLDPNRRHSAICLLGPAPSGERGVGHALVSDNTFSGRGHGNLVTIGQQAPSRRFGRVTFSNNICHHRDSTPSAIDATVMLSGDYLIAMGNHIEAQGSGFNSVSLDNQPRVVLMGNVTTGDFINLDTLTVVPSPHTSFNVKV